MFKYKVIFSMAVIVTCFAATISSNSNNNTTKQNGTNEIKSLLYASGLRALLANRIVGGDPITIEEVPWIVSIRVYGSHRCGGSIVTKSRILTAAHCTVSLSPSLMEIQAGSTSYSSGGHLKPVSRVTIHGSFSSSTLKNDISVLELSSELDTSLPTISTVPLPAQDYSVPVGSMSMVSGWGGLCENCSGSTTLRYVIVPIVSNDYCNESYGGSVTDGMLCAGYPDGNKDACQGDSGGPLVYTHLEGIVSWGIGCARPNSPGVYTRVSYYRNWIDSKL